ncbi:MAG: hypothetical protein SGARI_005592, partial [Bacillariaceae sp.]
MDSTSATDEPQRKRAPLDAAESTAATTSSSLPSKKRQKTEKNGKDDAMETSSSSSSAASSKDSADPLVAPTKSSTKSTTVDPVLLEHAKQRLSKFGARLFDPNRIKGGLVEPPMVIPLNDEFLTAFGKREKDFDKQIGRKKDYGEEIKSDDEDDGDENSKQTPSKKKTAPATKKESRKSLSTASTKIKINNLNYRT